MNQILLIDKPEGWTSFDVVAKVRGTLRSLQNSKSEALNSRQILNPNNQKLKQLQASSSQRPASKIKVGHAGTLDPFATGLLIILLGDECKNAQNYLKLDKSYEFTAKLGEISTTGDPEGEITPYSVSSKQQVVGSKDGSESDTNSNIHIPTSKEVSEALLRFVGEIEQIPPVYSAIKIDGKRAYKLAREGKKVEMQPRQVTVNGLQVTEYNYPYLKCRCDVSSGTYIRTLVEDIGKALGTGAYCSQLRRTRVGEWQIAESKTIEETIKALERKQ